MNDALGSTKRERVELQGMATNVVTAPETPPRGGQRALLSMTGVSR